MSLYYSGLSGIHLPVPKYQYPLEFQAASRLEYYASLFNSIEINSSFYKIPMARTVHRWATIVPGEFKFTFKMFREITHAKALAYQDQHIRDFFQVVNEVGSKKGCLLIQFPPSLTVQAFDRFARLAKTIRETDPTAAWKLCFELRHVSWYNPQLLNLLHSLDAYLVRHDLPSSATPFTFPAGATVYQRFHGPTGNYRGDYDHSFLVEFASYVRQWIAEKKNVFIYFNNTAGNAFNNLATLNKEVRSAE